MLGLEAQSDKIRNEKVFKDFLEVCQRCRILIHNGGVINRVYLDKCVASGIPRESLGKEGERVDISEKYAKRASARVFQVGYYLLHLYLQRSFPEDADLSYKSLLSDAHTFLENDLTKMSLRICDFAEYSAKNFDQDLKLRFAVNRAL